MCSLSRVLLSLLVAGGAAAAAAITVLITVHNLFSATAISITETFFFTIHFVRASASEMGVRAEVYSFLSLARPYRFLTKSVHFVPLATDTHTRTQEWFARTNNAERTTRKKRSPKWTKEKCKIDSNKVYNKPNNGNGGNSKRKMKDRIFFTFLFFFFFSYFGRFLGLLITTAMPTIIIFHYFDQRIHACSRQCHRVEWVLCVYIYISIYVYSGTGPIRVRSSRRFFPSFSYTYRPTTLNFDTIWIHSSYM